MKRTVPLCRKSPMRSRKPLARKTALAKANKKRRAKAYREAFGRQAQLCWSMPCTVCVELGIPQRARTEAHHEPPRSVGGRDGDTLPLCADHHRRRHDKGAPSFWAEYGIDYQRVIEHMRALVARTEAA